MKSINFSTWLFLFLLLLAACTKQHDNPFDQDDDDPTDNPVDTFSLQHGSFAWIHHHVLGQVCANSGCHDGTFEPDFRTIYSAYNTLVYQPVIKNNPQGTYAYRVLPGQASQSIFLSRMRYDIDGVSGIMPLVVEPGTDWLQRKDEYIAAIENWINSGAPDPMGNMPSQGNTPPQVSGVAAMSGSQWLSRSDGGIGPVQIPLSASSVRLFFAITDDQTPPQQIGHNQIKFSTHPGNFDAAGSLQLNILSEPVVYNGFIPGMVDYYHYIDISPQDFASPGQTIFFRIYVSDQHNPVTEIPTTGAAPYMVSYFSFRRSN